MHKTLENCAPKWAVGRICKRICACGHKFCKSDIVQLGIRKVQKDSKSAEVLAIEVKCPVCNKNSITTFSQIDNFRQLLCLLLEEIQKSDHIERARVQENPKSKRCGISDKEFSSFKNKLKKMTNYDEFLKELGEDIDGV